MKKVIIVRHGETDWNNLNMVMGWQNRHLNSIGKRQAEQLAYYLKQEYDINIIFSSDLQRAKETANIIHALAYPAISKPVLSEKLREQNQGKLEGLEFGKVPPDYDLKSISLAEALTKKPPKGESIKEFNKRTINCFFDLLSSTNSHNILLVTHGGVCTQILGNIKGWDPIKSILEIRQSNCCLNEIHHDPLTGKRIIIRENETV
jgi:probable phosphoglycerate mutase